MLSVPAMICGAVTFVATEIFGKSNAQWRRKFLELTCGIPSHGTLGRVFAVLEGAHFEACFPGLGTKCHHLAPRATGSH